MVCVEPHPAVERCSARLVRLRNIYEAEFPPESDLRFSHHSLKNKGVACWRSGVNSALCILVRWPTVILTQHFRLILCCLIF